MSDFWERAFGVRSQDDEPFAISFGFKTSQEVEIDGIWGVKTVGMASLYNLPDLTDEHQVPGGFKDIVDTWGRQKQPLVDFEHGLDRILGTAGIGWGLKYELRPEGLYAECFIPRDPTPPFRDNPVAKTARYRQVYAGILSGEIHGYSVQGVFSRAGKALKTWSMNILTICKNPCLPQAGFALGTKAVKSMMDLSQYDAPQDELVQPGMLSRPAWTQTMQLAQAHQDAPLHDHLLGNHPAHAQGEHSAESCGICGTKRLMEGLKTETTAAELAAQYSGPAQPITVTTGTSTGVHVGMPPANYAAFGTVTQPTSTPEPEASSGKKALLDAFTTLTDHYEQAIDAILAAGEPGAKAGRRLSTASRGTLAQHVATLDALKRDLLAFLAEESRESDGPSGELPDQTPSAALPAQSAA